MEAVGKSKQPYCFEVNEGELFAFAGIWDRWKNAEWQRSGNLLDSDHDAKRRDRCCPRPYASHPRFDSYDLWLDPGMKDVGLVSELLKPFNAKIMRSYPVSTRVNQVINDDAECSAPVQPVQTQDQLLF